MIAAVLSSRLSGTAYNADKMSVLSREIADEIKQKLKGKVLWAFVNSSSQDAQATAAVACAGPRVKSHSLCVPCKGVPTGLILSPSDLRLLRYLLLQMLDGSATSMQCRCSSGSSGEKAAGEN